MRLKANEQVSNNDTNFQRFMKNWNNNISKLINFNKKEERLIDPDLLPSKAEVEKHSTNLYKLFKKRLIRNRGLGKTDFFLQSHITCAQL